MADREQPYDPYIPSGGQPGAGAAGGPTAGGNSRTAALQAVSRIRKLYAQQLNTLNMRSVAGRMLGSFYMRHS